MVVHFVREDPHRAAHHDAKALFDEHGHRSAKPHLEEHHGSAIATDVLHRFDEKHVTYKREDIDHNNRSLAIKETTERVAFGLGNLQLLNVLLITVIPNMLIAGFILAARSIITGLIESGYVAFSKDYEGERARSFWYGNILGYAFILSAFFITFSAEGSGLFMALFALSFLLIGIFGALYLQSGLRLKGGSINKDRMHHYLKWISYYGIVIVALIFLGAGIVLDVFIEPFVILIGEMPLFLYGYAVVLFATGILVLITAYLSTRLRRVRPIASAQTSITSYRREVVGSIRATIKEGSFAVNMLAAGVIFYSAQLALNYYLGIHLYDHFDAFTPVAVLFSATLLTMFVVPLFFDKRSMRINGRSSLFLFGTGLALFIPLAFALVHIPLVRAGLISVLEPATAVAETAVDFLPMLYLLIGIAGSSIAGIAFSRLALDTMKPQMRVHFMHSLGLLTPIASGVLIALVFSVRALSGSALTSFLILSAAFLAAIVIFALLISGRLEQRFEQQSLTAHKV